MKSLKTFGLAVLLGCFTLSSQAKPVVTIADVYAQPNSRTYFTVNLKVDEDKADTYMSFDAVVTLPEGFTPPAMVGEKANNLTVWEGAQALLGTSISMASQYPMPGSEINGLASFELIVGDVEVKDYEVTLSNIRIESAAGIDRPDDVSFTIHISDVLTLDENSQVAPTTTSDAVPIKVLRTLNANEWSTICLPFSVLAASLTTVFGNDVKVAELSGYELEKEGDNITGINVKFTSSSVIRANQPYIIYVSSELKELSITQEISSVDPKPKEIEDDMSLEIYASMIPTYVAKTLVPAQSLFLSEGKFWYSAGKTKMKAFRAYFTFADVLSSYADASSRIKFTLSDGDTQTEIQIPELMPMDGEYYDLKGQRVETPSKGIYIKDGKKVVVK